jgi:hypothetical protein
MSYESAELWWEPALGAGIMIRLLLAFLAVAGLTPTMAAPQAAGDLTVVTVVGVVGKWQGNFHRTPNDKPGDWPFTFGEDLYAENMKLRVNCDGGNLVLLVGKDAHSFPCVELDGTTPCAPASMGGLQKVSCGGQISLKFARPNIVKTFVMSARTKPFSQYVSPVSRGLEAQLDDAVVPLMGDKIDLAAAMKDMDAGSYRVRFESLTAAHFSAGPLAVQWSGSAPAYATATGIKPGLYKVASFDPSGRPVGGEAWVLVCGAENFQKSRATCEAATDITLKWPEEVDARAPRAYLRGVLDALSVPAEAKPKIQ